MPTIGTDCEIVLDGTGYFVKPGSYQMHQPRIRSMTPRADGGLSYVDLGTSKRRWKMTLLCLNDLLSYDGTPTGVSGQQYRDALHSSYLSSSGSSVQFKDPLNGTGINVHFDDYSEKVQNLHTQQIPLAVGGSAGLSYEITIRLIEV